MSTANVLPTALPEGHAQLYPNLPSKATNAENFPPTVISKIDKQITDQVEHDRLVLKKYKRDQKLIDFAWPGCGAKAVLSSGAVATSLTGVGIVVGAPLGAFGALCGAVSTGLTFINKKFEREVNKHTRIHTLAVVKHDSINSYVSQDLAYNKVSDTKFKLIN